MRLPDRTVLTTVGAVFVDSYFVKWLLERGIAIHNLGIRMTASVEQIDDDPPVWLSIDKLSVPGWKPRLASDDAVHEAAKELANEL